MKLQRSCAPTSSKPIRKSILKSLCERGLSQLGLLLTVVLLGLGTYVGMQVVPFFIYYYEIEGHFEAMAEKAAIKKDSEIREFLEDQIRKMNLPVEKEDLVLRRNAGIITISLKYEEILVLDLGEDRVYDIWVFKFHPKAEKKFT